MMRYSIPTLAAGFLMLMLTHNAHAAAPAEADVPREEQPEPEITIIQQRDATVQEYRLGGVLYMIKVTPRVGPAYYLTDTDGDGNLETRRSDLDPPMLVPRWVLFKWR